MKVTYIENLPLDGAGTMVNPAYKWLQQERTECCDFIVKAGFGWYMMKGGYIHHSIDVTKITKIEVRDVVAKCGYEQGAKFPFYASIDNRDGKHICNVGSVDFESIRDTILKQ